MLTSAFDSFDFEVRCELSARLFAIKEVKCLPVKR